MLRKSQILLLILVVMTLGSFSISSAAPCRVLRDFKKASKQNSVLVNSLKWQWGKPQTGWYLYVPLVSKTLKATDPPDSIGFAAAVASWQKSKGLTANGVVNQKTLFSFIKHWQSKRLKPIYEAKEIDLLTAPIADFYDSTRDIELLMVDKRAYYAFKKMLVDADEALTEKHGESGKYLSIISSYRSPAYQAGLRKKQPGCSGSHDCVVFKGERVTCPSCDLRELKAEIAAAKQKQEALLNCG